METYIAWLRGINVGGKNRLPMIELTEILQGIGLSHIKTYIQSGNVVFQSKKIDRVKLSQQIGAAIEKRCGFWVQVMILDRDELKNAMVLNPFLEAEAEPNTLHFFFLSSLPENPDLKALESVKKESEQFRLIGKFFISMHLKGWGGLN
jgi:uncharacterized protein (DUF1697 family)